MSQSDLSKYENMMRKPSDKNKIRGFVQLIILIISYMKMTYASVKMCVTEYLFSDGFYYIFSLKS